MVKNILKLISDHQFKNPEIKIQKVLLPSKTYLFFLAYQHTHHFNNQRNLLSNTHLNMNEEKQVKISFNNGDILLEIAGTYTATN